MKAVIVLTAALLSLPSAAPAQSFSRDRAQTVIEETARLIERHYVHPEKKALLVARLREGLASGRYPVSDVLDFAQAVTADLEETGKDRHLGISYDPAESSALAAPRPPAGAAASDAIWDREARMSNHGLTEMRILDGNVRYLRIASFAWRSDASGAAYDAAMAFLKGGDAVIVDIRGNGGGGTSAVRYAISHFMPPEPERLLMTFTDDDGKPDQSRVLSYLPAGRVTGKPLYVLVDPGTVSAAEEFAYHVRQFRLGKLVGGNTAGAANNNQLFPLSNGFVASISFFSPKHPVSGTNWEQTGIRPDIEVAPETALAAAHVAALEEAAAKADAAERKRFDWALVAARAQLRPVRLGEAELRRYQGRFGERLVRLERGELVYRRGSQAPMRMAPLGDDLFALGSGGGMRARLRIGTAGVSQLELLYSDGETKVFDKTG